MPGSYVERRRFKRADLILKVEYSIMSLKPQVLQRENCRNRYVAESANISEGGMQILAEQPIEPGQIVRLSVFTEGKNINAFANVIWAAFDGEIRKFRAGMQFYYLSGPIREKIRVLIG